jgi:hypothetical protein
LALSPHIIHSFAAIKPSNNAVAKGEPGTDLWLWDRLTIRISRITFKVSEDDSHTEINEKISHYDKMMKIAIPKQWKELVSNRIPLMCLFS